MKGQCNACDARAQLMCTGCYGVFYCSEECHLEDVDRHNHQVPVCQQAGKNVPAIVGTARDRIGVIRLLNSFTEESIREAIERLSMVENVSAPFGHRVTIIMTDDDETEIPCRLYDRACTDGLTLWISRLMLTHKITPREIGFVLPPDVSPWTFVILHEFAHILMQHSTMPNVSAAAKEIRANCWATRYISLI